LRELMMSQIMGVNKNILSIEARQDSDCCQVPCNISYIIYNI
jgi:hypothetical protein